MIDDETLPEALSFGATSLEPEAEAVRKILFEALAHANDGEFTDAISVCRRAIDEYPTYSEPLFVLGLIAFRGGDEGLALEMAEQAHEIDPDVAEYLNFLAATATRVGRLADGVYFAKLAIAAEPHPYLKNVLPEKVEDLQDAFDTVALSQHGVEGQRLYNSADYQAAYRELSAHARLHPEDMEALLYLARTSIALGRLVQALGALHAIVRAEPENMMAIALMGQSLAQLGRFDEAEAAAKRAISDPDLDLEVYSVAMQTLQSSPSVSADELRATAIDYAERYAAEMDDEDEEPGQPGATPHIGFISNAFYRSENADFFASWFRYTATNEATVSGYEFSVARDGVTTQIKNGCTSWREVRSLDPITLGYTMTGDQLDVLVDLSSTDGITCSSVFGTRPARYCVGVTTLQEPGLMPGITHILSDEAMAEADRAMCLDGQQVLEINGSLFARPPIDTVSQDTPAPALSNGHVTFGAIADLKGVSVDYAFTVSEILRQIDGSRLLLFVRDGMTDAVRHKIRDYFLHAGIVERVQFVYEDRDEEKSLEESIARSQTTYPQSFWREVDLLLDTFPFNGRIATQEALWSGVPVVTERDNRRAGNVGASILTAAGRPNWIAGDHETYIETAVSLARDAGNLDDERRKLQSVIAKSLLFQPQKTAVGILSALINLAKS